MAKISVIVPIYNAEQWLERCIESIVAQTYADWELLLIDDGSTDHSGDICDRYAASDPRIKAFHKPNGGLSSARNYGMGKCACEWITFADADDFTYPCWLENYDVERNTDFDLICQGFETDREFSEEYGVDKKTHYGIDYEGDIKKCLDLLHERNILGYTWCKAYRRSIIKKNNLSFDTNIKLKEDEIFLLQYSKFSRFAKCTKNAGYMYFIPDWRLKYCKNQQERRHRGKVAFDVIKSSRFPKSSCITRYIIEDFTCSLISLFKESHSKEYIKEIRELLKYDYWRSQLFFPTKLVIILDPTCVISKWWVTLHQRIHRVK